jgi:RNA polymerase sigma-70 factor, ECF subfamily
MLVQAGACSWKACARDAKVLWNKAAGLLSQPPDMDFTALVDQYYRALYQFALSLAHSEADAADLTQETYLRWAEKGSQLRDHSKVKTWLFTTLYRLFLARRRHVVRFPHDEIGDAEHRLPPVEPEAVRKMEGSEVMAALEEIEETFRAPLVLFYLEDHSYLEIAEILDVPPGTVMSRLFRGKAMLRAKLEDRTKGKRPRASNIVPIKTKHQKKA